MKPLVSIILPTYNRADTIRRAIASVQAQTLQDWELIVVDDGSTDTTASLIAGLDPRMILIREQHQGLTEARNSGLLASTGEYLAFLDSDDEFLPYHLELCLAFLEAFPNEHFVSAELLESFGQDRFVNHYRVETSDWYPGVAAQIRSHMLDLPAGETDGYLRVYESREPIGSWGSHIVEQTGHQDAFLYRGRIFEHLRWGFLIALPATVIKRTALEMVGFPAASYRLASDFHFMANLCDHFRANFLSIPTYIKHELNTEGRVPLENHVGTVLACAQDLLHSFDELFWSKRRDDRELCALRGLRQFRIAKVALEFGQRDVALQCLKEARQSLPGFWRPLALELFVRSLPQAEMSRKAWNTMNKGAYACKQLIHGELSLGTFLRKVKSRVG